MHVCICSVHIYLLYYFSDTTCDFFLLRKTIASCSSIHSFLHFVVYLRDLSFLMTSYNCDSALLKYPSYSSEYMAASSLHFIVVGNCLLLLMEI